MSRIPPEWKRKKLAKILGNKSFEKYLIKGFLSPVFNNFDLGFKKGSDSINKVDNIMNKIGYNRVNLNTHNEINYFEKNNDMGIAIIPLDYLCYDNGIYKKFREKEPSLNESSYILKGSKDTQKLKVALVTLDKLINNGHAIKGWFNKKDYNNSPTDSPGVGTKLNNLLMYEFLIKGIKDNLKTEGKISFNNAEEKQLRDSREGDFIKLELEGIKEFETPYNTFSVKGDSEGRSVGGAVTTAVGFGFFRSYAQRMRLNSKLSGNFRGSGKISGINSGTIIKYLCQDNKNNQIIVHNLKSGIESRIGKIKNKLNEMQHGDLIDGQLYFSDIEQSVMNYLDSLKQYKSKNSDLFYSNLFSSQTNNDKITVYGITHFNGPFTELELVGFENQKGNIVRISDYSNNQIEKAFEDLFHKLDGNIQKKIDLNVNEPKRMHYNKNRNQPL